MPLPALVTDSRQVVVVPPPSPTPAGPTVGGGGVPPRILPFTTEHQDQTNWCWAAVSIGIAKFYSATTTWQQCTLANSEFGQTDCCSSGAATCNRPWVLEHPLATVGHLDQFLTGSMQFTAVGSELDNSHPVACRIGWSQGGGHFTTLYGYDDSSGQELVYVGDPWYGNSIYPLTSFTNGYRKVGTWTHTYTTQP